MEIGEGNTNVWYLGGIALTNSLCIILSLSDQASDNKERSTILQAITTFKYSDNIVRTKVSTITLDFLRENQMNEFIKRFDEQSAAVMLARLASKKA